MDVMPMGRFEWERLVQRIIMPEDHKLVALILATYADPDGTRIRPGLDRLAFVVGGSEKAKRRVRRIVAALVKDWGLLALVARGGGRGGEGRPAVYRLVVPLDLLERHAMLGPDMRPIRVASQEATERSEAQPQAAVEPADEPATPDVPDSHPDDSAADRTPPGGARSAATLADSLAALEATQTPLTPVDKPDSLAHSGATRSGSVATIEWPAGAAEDRMSGQIGLIERPLCQATYQPPTTHQLHHDWGYLPAQPQTARQPPRPRSPSEGVKCAHGLPGGRRADGSPRCALCRRDIVVTAPPLPVGAVLSRQLAVA